MFVLFYFLCVPNQIITNTGPNAGAPLGESFWKLPNKRFNPDYYSTIKKPISMGQIRNKMIKGEYGNITEMTSDLFLMLDNAKKWFPPTNRVHKVSLNDFSLKDKSKSEKNRFRMPRR